MENVSPHVIKQFSISLGEWRIYNIKCKGLGINEGAVMIEVTYVTYDLRGFTFIQQKD